MSNKYIRPDGKNRFKIRSANLGTLPSAWLDEEFNQIIKYLNGFVDSATINASAWRIINDNFQFDTTSSFTVTGDLSGSFEALNAIKFTDNSGAEATTHIKSSVYNSDTDTTVVTVYDAVVPANIKEISVGFLSKDSTAIPSVLVETKSTNYTVGAKDQVLLLDTTNAVTEIWDEGGTGTTGTGKLALIVKLPNASDLKGKIFALKKVKGVYEVIVSSEYEHNTSYNDEQELVHNYTYNFQIFGEEETKNRVVLSGIGEVAVFVSDGEKWYEITPNATEKVKGLVRLATEEEMKLTSEQIAEGEELKKDIAISPFQADKSFLRTDARNNKFSSNFIYQAPNGVASLVDGSIVIHKDLGIAMPNGKDKDGVLINKELAFDEDFVYAPIEVSEKKKLLFVTETKTAFPVFFSNYFAQYEKPKAKYIENGSPIIWFDFSENKLKLSTDDGANYTTWEGAGPIAEYSGDGVVVSNLQSYGAVGFLTRETLGYIKMGQMYKKVYWTGSQNTTLTLPTPILIDERLLYLKYTTNSSKGGRVFVVMAPLTALQNGCLIGQINRGGENADKDYDQAATVGISDNKIITLTPVPGRGTDSQITLMEVGVIS